MTKVNGWKMACGVVVLCAGRLSFCLSAGDLPLALGTSRDGGATHLPRPGV
ncbi:MAG: hypothetical protein WBX03_15300 [Terriglobales bacterium]